MANNIEPVGMIIANAMNALRAIGRARPLRRDCACRAASALGMLRPVNQTLLAWAMRKFKRLFKRLSSVSGAIKFRTSPIFAAIGEGSREPLRALATPHDGHVCPTGSGVNRGGSRTVPREAGGVETTSVYSPAVARKASNASSQLAVRHLRRQLAPARVGHGLCDTATLSP